MNAESSHNPFQAPAISAQVSRPAQTWPTKLTITGWCFAISLFEIFMAAATLARNFIPNIFYVTPLIIFGINAVLLMCLGWPIGRRFKASVAIVLTVLTQILAWAIYFLTISLLTNWGLTAHEWPKLLSIAGISGFLSLIGIPIARCSLRVQ